ncbi:MAG: B12-binding domain-containing radical SAM protein [Thaumarchaeota archaeon]|nr:B12-binding domain-containing radical SAM protein [Nitrososphaerota archaeon]
MKVNLIYPHVSSTYERFCADTSLPIKIIRRALHLGKTSHTPPLALLMLGAVTPPDIEVQIIDDRLNEIDFDQQVDLVGISVTATMAAPRAYEIANEYHRRGVTVVMGGIHPTALPQEAIQHADSVVMGEGEEAWPRVLADYKHGELKPFYRGRLQNELDRLPIPRRELIRDTQNYLTAAVVTTSRGCENGCSFCSAQIALGKKRRVRSVESVIAELSKLGGKVVFFMDDNLGWDLTYAKKLFRALIPLRIRWFGNISLLAFEDTEFLELAAKAGATVIETGFESLTPVTIAGIKKQKTNDPARYKTLVRRIHDYGILIKGGFVLGLDGDDKSTLESTADFINETCIELPNINTVIPYPGTPLFRQFEREGRLLHKNWTEYDTGGDVVFKPKGMTRDELMEAYAKTISEVFSIGSTISRIVRAGTVSSIIKPLGGLYWNLKQRSIAIEYKAMLKNNEGMQVG